MCQEGPGPEYAPVYGPGFFLPYYGYDFNFWGQYWYPVIAQADALNGNRYYQIDRQYDGAVPCWLHKLPSASGIYAFRGDLSSVPVITGFPTVTANPPQATAGATVTVQPYPPALTATPAPTIVATTIALAPALNTWQVALVSIAGLCLLAILVVAGVFVWAWRRR